MTTTPLVRLYTTEVLGLATQLSNFPLTPDLPLRGSARSAACGSTIELGIALDSAGRIERIGMRVQACAIGQAAAALFAAGAAGHTSTAVNDAAQALQSWLSGAGPLPDWPRLHAIAAARDYPGRHGAVLLPWNAALQALPTDSNPG